MSEFCFYSFIGWCFAVVSLGQPNFGAIEIDWNAVPPQIKFEVRDLQGHSVAGVEFPISELKPSNARLNQKQGHSFERHCNLETELPWLVRRRLALLFFGTIAGMLFTAISTFQTAASCFPLSWQHLSSCSLHVYDMLSAVFVIAVVLLGMACLSATNMVVKKHKVA